MLTILLQHLYKARFMCVGPSSWWRKATILADATAAIVCEDVSFTGNMLIDETYLRSKGFITCQFVFLAGSIFFIVKFILLLLL